MKLRFYLLNTYIILRANQKTNHQAAEFEERYLGNLLSTDQMSGLPKRGSPKLPGLKSNLPNGEYSILGI